MSLGTLSAWGMTRAGELFELPTPERRTSGPGSSSLPTPRAQARERIYARKDYHWNLEEALAYLPTPVADHSRGLPQPESDYQSLPNVALSLLPTPAVNDMGAGKDPVAWEEWAARQKSADGRPAPHGKSLEQEALRMLPTPTAVSRDRSPEEIARRWIDGERGTRGPNLDDLPWMIPSLGASTPPPLAGSMGRNRNSPHQVGVDEAILSLLGTPTAAMSHRSPQGISKNPNPREIASMVDQGRSIGVNTSQPSGDGSDSQDQSQPPLFSTTDATG